MLLHDTGVCLADKALHFFPQLLIDLAEMFVSPKRAGPVFSQYDMGIVFIK